MGACVRDLWMNRGGAVNNKANGGGVYLPCEAHIRGYLHRLRRGNIVHEHREELSWESEGISSRFFFYHCL